jgi:uncharacterized membrane protein
MLHELSHSFLSIFCHQDPAICWQHGGLEVLCPRCIGMHAGFLITLVLLHRGAKQASLVVAVAVLCAAALEWCLAHTGLRESTDVSRLVTGLATGWAVGSLCRDYLENQILVRLSSAAIVLAALCAVLMLGLGASLAPLLALLVVHTIIAFSYIAIARLRQLITPTLIQRT